MNTARVNGETIEIDTPNERHLFRAAPPLAFAEVDSAADRTVFSPLTGTIVKVLVREGAAVGGGD